MAQTTPKFLRLADIVGVCRNCASLSARRTITSAAIARPTIIETQSRASASIFKNGRVPSTLPKRNFSSTGVRSYKTVEEAKSKYRLGPFSWQAGLLFLVAGAGLTVYFRYEKARMARARIAEANKGIGKPLVGGPFHLHDHDGKEFTEQNLKGKYSLVYFGFTHCPDICPEELDKMAGMIDQVKEKHGNVMLPVFISCDPARDTSEVIKRYLAEFHPDIIGMTGTWQEVKDVCKAYRVYFSTPPDVKPGQDYLVDHSIYFYLMDPEGDFVEAIGRNFTVDAAAKVINDHIADWRGPIKKD
ncbi:Protein SCO1, mitochondrial [Acrodontium crateriforme]|uniref:Protein SCO1, mitochondrial n=1 Tax=Acrodontium crateriforme TaxID=150365 RepID=A0AAQ3M6G5_9PEZI|nr:Protein SCO1, mitochondrial [Acrodontium crateriforme]